MKTPEFEPDFYLAQIDQMVGRHRGILASWGMNWDRFYDPVLRRIGGRRYFEWVFLCGLDPILREASALSGKSARSEFLTESSRRRLMDICLDDERTESYLRGI